MQAPAFFFVSGFLPMVLPMVLPLSLAVLTRLRNVPAENQPLFLWARADPDHPYPRDAEKRLRTLGG